jgi:hypothetical protein
MTDMTDIEKVIHEAKTGMLPYESWERLPGETGAAFAAFCAYRDYGPERNIRRAVAASCKEASASCKEAAASCTGAGADPGGGVSAVVEKKYRLWRQWSMRFQWVKRAGDYDMYLDHLNLTEMRKTIEERGEVHRKVTDQMLQVVSKKLDLMEPGELCQGAVVEWVESAISTERDILGVKFPDSTDKPDGKTGSITFAADFEGL